MLARLFILAMVGLVILSAGMRVRDERVEPVSHSLTDEECSACHLVYPAAMLSSASWTELMTSLESHFGEDASLDDESVSAITRYLTSNAADSTWTGNRFSRGQINDWPIRITETDYWLREHKNQTFIDPTNSEMMNQSDCAACHESAAKGDFYVHDA
jgi:hypothetical protein